MMDKVIKTIMTREDFDRMTQEHEIVEKVRKEFLPYLEEKCYWESLRTLQKILDGESREE